MKQVIIFKCLDNFNKYYKYVVTTTHDKVVEVVKNEMSLSTEIIDYEVVNCYEH